MISEQIVIDKATVLLNLINETDFSGEIKTVHEAIVRRLLCEAKELGLNIDKEPFASLGNRQFTFTRVPEEAYLHPWYYHVNNFCQVEQVLQNSKTTEWQLDIKGILYKVSIDPTAGTRTYYLNDQYICDCTGTPTLQDFKDLFSEERKQYYINMGKALESAIKG